MNVLWAVGLVWAGLCVGFVVGAVWVSLFAERRINTLEADIAAMDHARFERQQGRQNAVLDESWLLDEAGDGR